MNLNDAIEKLPNVGEVYKKRLARLDIKTIRDLLYHFPFRYEDFRTPKKIKDLSSGTSASLIGEIIEISNVRTKKRKMLTKAVVSNESGSIEAVWFNQPYLTRTLKKGFRIGLAGRVEPFAGRITLVSPEFEVLTGGRKPTHTSGLIPIYPETARVSSKWLRSQVKKVLSQSAILVGGEFLPRPILEKHNLEGWDRAMENMHFPKDLDSAKIAKARFAFEELFLFNLRALRRRQEWEIKKSAAEIPVKRCERELEDFIKGLPFTLTKAQKTTLTEILDDLEQGKPMNRLIQGDVGSGKTVVAAAAAYLTYLAGAKTVFMAPTEVLVDQHFTTLQNLLEPKGMKIALHTGSKKPSGSFDLWLGTHALFYRKGDFEGVGLVIIDEQHRFGVEQRGKLLTKTKKGAIPHLLTLTATPIPRTLALTVYGDLDVSVIDELPPGRKPVKTFVVPENKRAAGYQWVREKVKEGNQAFVICPLIEESEKESMQQVKAATSEYEKLQKLFPELTVGLLHGRLKAREKEKVLNRFRDAEVHILVATPVVEVGIDVPSATIMIVEAAERFGLASLHQLRGRVGRGNKISYCFLFTEEEGPTVTKRLKSLEKTSSGFELAELDLKLRGPGEIYGVRQHGLIELKVADLTDTRFIKQTRESAQRVLSEDPKLSSHPRLARELERFSSDLVEPN